MKEETYKLLVSQIASLIDGEKDTIAIMSNVAAAIHQTMGFWWTGFYRVVVSAWPLPRPRCMYAHPIRQGRMWHGLAKSRDCRRARRRTVSWSYSL